MPSTRICPLRSARARPRDSAYHLQEFGMERGLYTADHEAFRDIVRTFVDREVVAHLQTWEERRLIDRSVWLQSSGPAGHGPRGPTQHNAPRGSDIPPRTSTLYVSS